MGVSGIERSVAQWIYDLPSWTTPLWRAVMQSGTRLSIVLVALVLLVADRKRAALVVAVGGYGAWAASQALKDVFERDRPTAASLGRPMRDLAPGQAFPSTHTTIAAALATAIIISLPLSRRAHAAVGAVVAGTAVARIHVTAHWPLDVVGGAALGIVTAGAVGLLTRRWA